MPTIAEKKQIAETYIKRLTRNVEFAEVALRTVGLSESEIHEYQIEAVLSAKYLKDTKELIDQLIA